MTGHLKTIELQVQVAKMLKWKFYGWLLLVCFNIRALISFSLDFTSLKKMLSAQRVYERIVPVLIIDALQRSPFLSLQCLSRLNPGGSFQGQCYFLVT